MLSSCGLASLDPPLRVEVFSLSYGRGPAQQQQRKFLVALGAKIMSSKHSRKDERGTATRTTNWLCVSVNPSSLSAEPMLAVDSC